VFPNDGEGRIPVAPSHSRTQSDSIILPLRLDEIMLMKQRVRRAVSRQA